MKDKFNFIREQIRLGRELPLTVIKPSLQTSLGVDRGVILCAPRIIEFLLLRYSKDELKKRWFIIDSSQWYGYGHNQVADLHFIASPELIPDYLNSPYSSIPFSTLGDGGDFVNPLHFFPIPTEPLYDIVLVASWAPFKQHYKLFEAAKVLQNLGKPVRILVVGSYCVPGHMDTLEDALRYEREVKDLAKELRIDVNFVDNSNTSHENVDGSLALGKYTKKEINVFINQARIAVLPSFREGTTRFVAEALCANKPVIVLRTLEAGTTKYINSSTGLIADDTPNGLAGGIVDTLKNIKAFSPRQTFLTEYGFSKSNRGLEAMIENIVKQQKDNLFTVPNCQYGGDMWSADYYGEFKEGMEYP